jgi:hypothetical protein
MKAPRRHPARITRYRLTADEKRWEARLTPDERAAFLIVWGALYRIEGEDEAATAAGGASDGE